MKEYYYLDRLKEKNKYADYLHYELDRRFYSYGNQQKLGYEKVRWCYKVIYIAVFELLIYIYLYLITLFSIAKKKKVEGNNVLSTAYHGFNVHLKEKGYSILGTPWVVSKNKNKLKLIDFITIIRFKIRLLTGNFNYLISSEFSNQIEVVKSIISQYISKNEIRAVFLPQDVGFFEKLIIDEARKKGVPTFVIFHGAALRYGNSINDNRTDYLCVFGDVLKERLIRSGFIGEKILITGHPKYSNVKIPENLKFDIQDVLVATKPMPGQPLEVVEVLEGRARDTNRLKDRGNLILYLMDVQSALIGVGVKRAKLRLHPSESPNWYLKYIDTNFFSIDKLNLSNSLAKSTLVIGPSSSLFFDAIYAGVNYLIYEPVYDDGLDILNDPVGFPFDGGDVGIPVAKEVNDLISLLDSKKSVDIHSIEKFIKPDFNIQEVLNLLK